MACAFKQMSCTSSIQKQMFKDFKPMDLSRDPSMMLQDQEFLSKKHCILISTSNLPSQLQSQLRHVGYDLTYAVPARHACMEYELMIGSSIEIRLQCLHGDRLQACPHPSMKIFISLISSSHLATPPELLWAWQNHGKVHTMMAPAASTETMHERSGAMSSAVITSPWPLQ